VGKCRKICWATSQGCAPDGTQVGDIMHPSPANPKANKDWDLLIEAQLQALGVDI